MKNRFIKRVISLSLIITSLSVCMPQFANIAYADNVTTTDSNNNSTNKYMISLDPRDTKKLYKLISKQVNKKI